MLASNHKRMLRNTAMLYMRMLLAMAVTLYTSRVVLDVLGIEDFGIYHVVAGFVALLGFLQGAMTTATQRYFAFDLGESGGKDLSRIFNTSVMIHGLLALCVVLLAETAGYWFVSTQLTIPGARMTAAMAAYHLAVISFAISVIMVPFTAMLLAHERMGIFAIIGMLDVIFKLAAVIALQHIGSDKLSTYAWLLLAVGTVTFIIYFFTNKLLFPEIKLRLQWHNQQFRTMLSYTAWNTWGNLASALSGQGNNVLLNVFFGPSVNAGRSIALQANGALQSFVQNVQAALNPQIIKLYASGEKAQMHSLVLHASKYSFFLLFMLALPVLMNTEALLDLWLVEVPPNAVVFLQLTIVASLIDTFSGSLMTAAQATGHIRLYHTVVGIILLLNVPISYAFLVQGFPPSIVLLVSIGLCISALIARLFIISPLINLPIHSFLSKVLTRSLMVAFASISIALVLQTGKQSTFFGIAWSFVGSMTATAVTIWLIGLNGTEKSFLIAVIKSARSRLS